MNRRGFIGSEFGPRVRRGLGALATVLLIGPAYASPHNPDTDWFRDAGWGVFVHYLWDVQNVVGRATSASARSSPMATTREAAR